MRFLRLVLLIATAMLAGCGGGKGDGGSNSASTVQPDLLSITRAGCCDFGSVSQSHYWTPPSEFVDVWASGANIRTSQTGAMFSHRYTATSAWGGQITIQPAAPTEIGTFTGAITVSACS